MAETREKRFSMSLTERELWHLKNSYDASFTDPDSMNPIERRVMKVVDRTWMRARMARDKK